MGETGSSNAAPETGLAEAPYVKHPESQLWDQSFKLLYAKASRNHHDVLRITEQTETGLADQLRTTQLAQNSVEYVLICIAAICALAAIPLVIGALLRTLGHYRIQIDQAVSNRQFWEAHPEIAGAIGIASFGMVAYAVTPFYLHRMRRLRGFLRPRSTVFYIDTGHVSVRLFIAISCYSLVPPLLITFAATIPHSISIPYVVLAIWLGIPLLTAGLTCLLFLLVIIFQNKIDRIERKASLQLLSLRLLEILDDLDEATDPAALTSERRQGLIRSIIRVSGRLSRLHDYGGDPASDWAKFQMKLAARNFIQLAVWLYFPQQETLAALRVEIVRYLNITLSGRLHELPRADSGHEAGLSFEQPTRSGWRKFIVHAGVAAYLILPVFAYALALQFAHLQVGGQLQTVASLLYLLWVIVGLLSFSERITPESRTLLIDTIRAMVGKK